MTSVSWKQVDFHILVFGWSWTSESKELGLDDQSLCPRLPDTWCLRFMCQSSAKHPWSKTGGKKELKSFGIVHGVKGRKCLFCARTQNDGSNYEQKGCSLKRA